MTVQEGPESPKDRSRTPKMAASWPNISPQEASQEDGPKKYNSLICCRCLKGLGVLRLPDAPRWHQRPFKTTHAVPSRAPKRPKRAPRRPKRLPRRAPKRPSKKPQEAPKEVPKKLPIGITTATRRAPRVFRRDPKKHPRGL